MAKYKRKSKLNKTSSIVIILIFILISMSIGYCIWTDSQVVNGHIRFKYKETKIENIEFIDENGDGNYTTLEEDYDGLIKESRLDFLNNYVTYTVDENTDKMEIVIEYGISRAWTVWGRWNYITFKFKNNNPEPMVLQYNKFLEKTIKYDSTLTAPEVINPGEIGEFTISMYMKGNTKLDWGYSKYKFRYKIGEVVKTAYLTFDIIND